MNYPLKNINNTFPQVLSYDITGQYPNESLIKVCLECLRNINKRLIPPLAKVNELHTMPIPEELKNLNWIEEACIKRVRPCQVNYLFFFKCI